MNNYVKGEYMLDNHLFQRFLTLTERNKLDYLYTFLVEKDIDKLHEKYGPDELQVLVGDNLITMTSKKLKNARLIKKTMMMDGMILLNEEYEKIDGVYIVTYDYEGMVAPICFN